MSNPQPQRPTIGPTPTLPWLLLAAILLLAASACNGSTQLVPPATGSTPAGLIVVDTPEVYGRERLIRDREQQKRWLTQQLDIADDLFDNFEALVQARSSQSSSVSLGIDATPTFGNTIREAEAAADQIGRDAAVAELEHKIQIAELEQQLARIESGEQVTAPTTAGAGANGGATTTPTAAGSTPTAAAPSTGAPAGATGQPSSTPTASSAQPPATGIDPIAAKSDPTSRLIDRLAYREIVRQELLENDLDDAHDLLGNTLYRLAFDTTVFPDSDTSAWAVVHLAVVGSATCESTDNYDRLVLNSFKDQWLADLNRNLQLTVADVASALLHDIQGEAQEGPVIVAAPEKAALIDAAREELEDVTEDHPTDTLESQAFNAAARTVAASYRSASPDAASFLKFTAHLGNVTARLNVPDGGAVKDTFCSLLELLDAGSDAYAVTPKEAVQRIGNLAAFQAAQERALSLAAAAGTVGIDAAVEAMRQLDYRTHSILRQPLVVGFSGDLHKPGPNVPLIVDAGTTASAASQHARFGWILGPRFKARPQSGFDFRHSSIQRPLSAVLSVPGWWTSVDLELTTCWITEGLDARVTDPTCSHRTHSSMKIRLPGDHREITSALFPQPRYPLARLLGSPDMEFDRSETLVILGTNLWRNPTVTLGNQLATKVEILPDMNGLLVGFDKVSRPAGWTTSQTWGFADVTVWTSEGSARAGTVKLNKPPKEAEKDAPKANFEVTTRATAIVAHQGQGSVNLTFDFATKPPTPPVTTVFLEVEGADVLPATSTGSCLVKNTILEVNGSCLVTLALDNLVSGKVVTIVTYRKDGDKKVHHTPISLEVR